jgi:pimeloyl-ACP methyl ester carboxylesterase
VEYVEANGIRFGFLAEGSGPLVLLLHGFPDTAHTWDHVRPLLAKKGFRAVSPFLRGYAPTAVPERDTDQETLAHDAVALISALGAEEAIVVGHDWGASAAYGAAALAPTRVTKLVTLAIPHPATLKPTFSKVWGVRHFFAYKLPGATRRFARNDFEGLTAIYRRWSPTWDPGPEEFAATRECFSNAASLDAAFGYYRALSLRVPGFMRQKVQVPTVAFCALDDPMAKPDDYARARRIFAKDYQVEEMPGGHFLHREHPDEFGTRLLRHF